MKILILIVLVVASVLTANCSPTDTLQSKWSEFKSNHSKHYKNQAEHDRRMGIFSDHLQRIQEHNSKNLGFQVGENKYSDMTNEEFKKTMNGLRVSLSSAAAVTTPATTTTTKATTTTTKPTTTTTKPTTTTTKPTTTTTKTTTTTTKPTTTTTKPTTTTPTTTKPTTTTTKPTTTTTTPAPAASVDWRTQGYVTPVKDQGQCGSCWSFSATGALEGQIFKKTGKLLSFSEQNLVDCLYSYGGCNGGMMDDAWNYIKSQGGIPNEATYPYTATNTTCKFNKANVVATDTGVVYITRGDETALKNAVTTIGPIAIAIDASNWSFQVYKSGIYNEPACSSTNLDHAVLVVGYGTLNGQDYWLVKNSWGTSWGMSGYIMMARNANNKCGVASLAMYPTV